MLNSVAPDAFVEVVKVTINTGLWDAVLAWYSPSAAHRIYFYGSEHGLGIYLQEPDRWNSFNLSENSWTIWLLYFDYFPYAHQIFWVAFAALEPISNP